MVTRRSLGWPITLGVVMIVLLVVVIIGWIVVTVARFQATEQGAGIAILIVGTLFLVLILVGVVLYLLLTIKAINLNQRQANFIDSVTHELKSPIASLKLYLQTLDRHKISDQQRADFHRFMLEDLRRLDHMIDHLLDAARLDHRPSAEEYQEIELSPLLTHCAELVCQHYRKPLETVQLNLQPIAVVAREVDLEIVFRNLLDNAMKHSGTSPQIEVDSRALSKPGRIAVRVGDNGPGIPLQFRRKIFARFSRLGNELERSQTGTGLGLFIVRTLVRRMHGKVNVRGKPNQGGTIFEVELRGRLLTGDAPLEPPQTTSRTGPPTAVD